MKKRHFRNSISFYYLLKPHSSERYIKSQNIFHSMVRRIFFSKIIVKQSKGCIICIVYIVYNL